MHNEQVYTPSKIVKFILDEVGFKDYVSIFSKHIIDNSCGNGNFLVEIVERLFKFIPNIDNAYLETYVHGIEIESNAYNETIKRLDELVAKYGMTDVKWDIVNGNALTITDFDDDMDYVVGNPPYCNVHHLSKEDYILLKKKFLFCRDGMTDLYLAFYEKGLRMLNKKGILGYITPNSWLTSNAGFWLRYYLYCHNCLSKIYNFDTDKLFDNATTFTCVAILTKCSKGDSNVSVYHGNFDDIDKNRENCRIIDRCTLSKVGKIMTGVDDERVLDIIDYHVDDDSRRFIVKNGLATLKDKLFIIETDDKDVNIDVYSELFNETIIDCVKASKGECKYIIYPYDKDGKPLRYEDLCLNTRDILKRRAERMEIDTTSKDWYLFGRTQAIKDTNKYRISCNNLIRQQSDVILKRLPPLTAVYSGFYIMKKGMSQTDEGIDQLFHQVEDAMRTDLFVTYVKSIGKSKNGGYYTFSSKDLGQFLNYFYSI